MWIPTATSAEVYSQVGSLIKEIALWSFGAHERCSSLWLVIAGNKLRECLERQMWRVMGLKVTGAYSYTTELTD